MSTETTNKKIKIDNGTTFGRTYTDKAIDAKLPTDLIASANKLSLGVGNAPLGSGVNLSGFTYDEATKTLKAEGSGATLPAGTQNDPFKIKYFNMYSSNNDIRFTRNSSHQFYISVDDRLNINGSVYAGTPNISMVCIGSNGALTELSIYGRYDEKIRYRVRSNNESGIVYIPALADPTDDGTYNLEFIKNGSSYLYQWNSLKKTYNHYIVISDGTASNAIYLLIPSTNNLICNILTDLNTLLGTEPRFIQASGVVTDTASKLPIVAIKWQGSFSSSKIVTTSSEEATTKFTDITDMVIPA